MKPFVIVLCVFCVGFLICAIGCEADAGEFNPVQKSCIQKCCPIQKSVQQRVQVVIKAPYVSVVVPICRLSCIQERRLERAKRIYDRRLCRAVCRSCIR